MNILISDNWLRDFLKTEATPEKIAEYLTLGGPSVESLTQVSKDFVYSIEVTTNRVDSASLFGIAREVAAILPRFKIPAKLKSVQIKANPKFTDHVDYLKVQVDHTLCPRFTTVLIKNVSIKPSPVWMQARLKKVGIRPINNIVDISNYLMVELGQPTHTFDFDKIEKTMMILRASKRGEKIITLDGKSHILSGGDIVIEDGGRRLIDLAGIMGGENSAVDQKTRNVLFFVQTYNPTNIRKTSMELALRTQAATLFEKGLDPQLVETTIKRGIDLFLQLTKGKPEDKVLDIYPAPYKEKFVETSLSFITARLGVKLKKEEITSFLIPLGFKTSWQNDNLSVSVSSFRANDIEIQEDVIEEVARIYGYNNLPSKLPMGEFPKPILDSPFEFERRIKEILRGLGGIEVYTLSFVAKAKAALSGQALWVLKLKNPLGPESEYLRTSLAPSLAWAAHQNEAEKTPFHLFEMANVYLPIRGNLPEEEMMIAGIFSNYKWQEAKGVVEALLESLGTQVQMGQENARGFVPNTRLSFKTGTDEIGQMGILQGTELIFWEFEVEKLRLTLKPKRFRPIPKYPAQIEDIALVFPPRTLVGKVMEEIKKVDRQIGSVELIDIYNNTRTFRLTYQNPNRTLTDKEVEKIREKILAMIKNKFSGKLKN